MNPHTSNSRVQPIPKAEAAKIRLWLLIATGLFLVGIVTPMMTLSTFIFIENSFSVLSGVVELLSEGRVFLFLIVSSFSVLLPILKICVLFKLVSYKPSDKQRLTKQLHLMHEYGRWAMLDVMVVAVLIVTVKLGAIASIQIHYGLYFFGTAVVVIMLITNKVVKLTGTAGNAPAQSDH